MGFFKAIGRLLSSFIAIFTGKANKAADQLSANPDAMNAEYTSVIAEKVSRLNEFLSAVAQIVKIKMGKEAALEKAIKEESAMEGRRKAATAILKKHVASLQAGGMSKEDCKLDPGYLKHRKAIQTFTTKEQSLEADITRLEAEIKGHDDKINELKRDATDMQNDIETIRAEQGEAVADVITSREIENANKMLAGISEDGTSSDLQRLRDLRKTAKAEAAMSEVVAGTEAKRDAREYDDAAAAAEIDDDLDADLFGDDEPVAAPPAAAPKPVLPE